jgi:hypothetical protein
MSWLQITRYRLEQVRQQLGFVPELTEEDYREVAHWLPESAWELFRTMSRADQQHSLRVCRGLQERACLEGDLLAAALLHDVGKGGGRVPFWTRPVIVLGKVVAPGWLKRSVVGVEQLERKEVSKWRRALSFAWWHAEVGARQAERAGLSERAILYIRTHHQAHGPAALLHQVDEVS